MYTKEKKNVQPQQQQQQQASGVRGVLLLLFCSAVVAVHEVLFAQ